MCRGGAIEHLLEKMANVIRTASRVPEGANPHALSRILGDLVDSNLRAEIRRVYRRPEHPEQERLILVSLQAATHTLRREKCLHSQSMWSC